MRTSSIFLLVCSLPFFISGVHSTTQEESRSKYSRLRNAIESIRSSCGDICATTEPCDSLQGVPFNTCQKTVDCRALFESPHIEREPEFSYPPQRIPKYLIPDFLYDGRVAMKEFHIDYDVEGGTHLLNWSMEYWDIFSKLYDEDNLNGPYGMEVVKEIIRFLKPNITDVRGRHILIIGSQSPWIETLVLKAGARHITTMDYVQIENEHPQVNTITPEALSKGFLEGTLPLFDVVISFSSLEHSGLGRYGDALNPWGDLISMAKAWCVVKPRGQALIGVPSGTDMIEYNAHRIYGPLMFSHLFANWKLLYSEMNYTKFNEYGCSYCYQPLQLLEKINN